VTNKQIEGFVDLWKKILGLTFWDIRVVWGDELEEYFKDKSDTIRASTWRSRDYDTAKIYFNPREYHGWSLDEAERTAVHELLHLVFRDTESVIDQIEGLVHRDIDELITNTFMHHMEGAIDRLAYRLVELARRS
jgi:hypothetical protein